MVEGAGGFLSRAEGEAVSVQLRDRKLRGRLAGSDEFINLVWRTWNWSVPH